MGQPRVVIGVAATEAEHFADFLENHDCAAVAQEELQSANGSAELPVNGNTPTPSDTASEPADRQDRENQDNPGPVGAECPAPTAPGSSPGAPRVRSARRSPSRDRRRAR